MTTLPPSVLQSIYFLYRRTTVAAHERRELSDGVASAAIELQDGTIITSRSSSLLGPCAALLLNATKHLAGIPHEKKLIPEILNLSYMVWIMKTN